MVQEVAYQEPKRTNDLQDFIVELIVQGKSVRVPAKCYNRESASHTALAMLAISYPQIQGYNLLSADGLTLIEEVHPTPLFNHASPIIQQITGQQPLKMAVPLVKTVDPKEWEKMLADARKEGKVIQ